MSKTEELNDLFQDVTGKEKVIDEQETEQERTKSIPDGEERRALPTTEKRCPECGHSTAYYYLQQIRAADESETRFFICEDCGHKWRGYD